MMLTVLHIHIHTYTHFYIRRVLTVLHELQLAHIADSAIGNEITRGISGTERTHIHV